MSALIHVIIQLIMKPTYGYVLLMIIYTGWELLI